MNLQSIQNIRNKTIHLIRKNPQLFSFFILCVLVLITNLMDGSEKKDAASMKETEKAIGLDTYIPRGYTLIPIDVENKEQLSSLIEQKGVVNLFSVSEGSSKKSTLVAKNIKLVRAPKNPEVFAVLVKESQINQVMSFKGPFRAVIQSPSQNDQEVMASNRATVKVQYQN